MNADVEKAVGRLDGTAMVLHRDWNTVKQALRDQEAEIARMRKIEGERWNVVATRNAATERSEKADALLRECRQMLPDYCEKLVSRITAHLGAEQ